MKLKTILTLAFRTNTKGYLSDIYVTLHFADRRGSASPRDRNRAEITSLCVNRSPILYRFSCGLRTGAKAMRYSMNSLQF